MLAGRARELSKLFEERATDNEASGRLVDEVVTSLREAGFFGLWVPTTLGGTEANPLQSLEIIEELSRADGSTGWVVMAVALANATASGFLGDRAIEEMFSEGTVPIIAGQGIPNGRAVPDGDGYVVSGQWSYGSGLLHAEYAHSGTLVYEDGKPRLDQYGQPEIRIFDIPVHKVSLGGNWDVIGLRATGSVDYSMEPTYIAADYSHLVDAERPLRGGPFYTLGAIRFGTIGHSGFALGIGRRVLDELAEFARASSRKPGAIADSESFREDFARAEAKYRSARAWVFEVWNDVWTAVEEGHQPTTRQTTLIRTALNNITFTVVDVCEFAYRSAGGSALRAGTIQRCFRDMLAGAQHVSSSNAVLRECGRELMGMAEGQIWTLRRLVDPIQDFVSD